MFAAMGEFMANEYCFSKEYSRKTKLLKISASLKCGLVYHALNQLVNIQREINLPGCFEIGNDATQNMKGFTGHFQKPWEYHDDLTPFDERNSETIKKLVEFEQSPSSQIWVQDFLLCKFEILAQMFVGENLEKLEYMKQREQRLEHCLANLKSICGTLVKDDFIFSFKFFFIEEIISFLKETLLCISKKIQRISMQNISDNELGHLDAQQTDIIIDHIDKLSDKNTGEVKITKLNNMYNLTRKLLEHNPRYPGEWEKLTTIFGDLFDATTQAELIQTWSYVLTMRLNMVSHSSEIMFLKTIGTRLKKTFYQLILFVSGIKAKKQRNWNQRYQRVLLVFRAQMLMLRILKSLNFFSDGFVQARNFMANYQSLFDGTLFFKQLQKNKELSPLVPDFDEFAR